MMKKLGLAFSIVLIFILAINNVIAYDVDNSTDTILQNNYSDDILNYPIEEDILDDSNSKLDTRINASDSETFDSIGENFTISLLNDKKPLSNEKISFTVNGATYVKTTDSKGIASLQINLADGIYNITTKYGGNNLYKPCSKISTIKVNNTRYVEPGLTAKQVQQIINDSKPNNVIVFKGDLYYDLNLEITKSLTIVSYSNTQIKSSSTKPVFSIKGKESSLTTIKGFKIDSGGNGIVVSNSDYVEICQNEITSNGYGIIADSTRYLNITKNKVNGNKKDGIVVGLSEDAYIISNEINNNDGNGLAIGASKNVYVFYNTIKNNKKDGVLMDTEVGRVEYGYGPENLILEGNTINNNAGDGINIIRAGKGINITKNTISNNNGNGIAINKIGDNTIKSNVIEKNTQSGIRFKETYVKPKNQTIEHNVLLGNKFREVDARETYYDEGKYRLDIGENWYGNNPNICPKIKTSNLIFNIKQTSSYFFTVTITDSKGNIVADLPSRTGSYKVEKGRTKYFVMNGGYATIEIDASDNSNVMVTIDDATRTAKYKFEDPSYESIYVPPYDDRLRPINEVGQPYPGIPRPGLYQDIANGGGNNGNGNGDGSNPNSGDGTGNNGGNGTGNGNGNGVSSVNGNGTSSQGSEFYGNSTASQNTDPGHSANTPSKSMSSNSYQSPSTSSSSQGPSSSGSPQTNSVLKRITLEEDELIRISGLSFIVLLILLTVIYYYRDDIEEMASKM